MNTSCKNCGLAFTITDGDLTFYESVSPVFNGKKYTIPTPTHCPDCRQQRRLALCNERFFYPATCGLCKKRTITEHPPHSGKVIYCRECWHSDQWDPCSYGRDVDFSWPIFDQLKELWQDVPAQNLLSEGTNINSEYIHYAGFAKNCYLIMHSDYCENCYYGYGFKKDISCVDGFYNLHCELCYDCVDCHRCYGLRGSQDCINCHSSGFLRDCIGCKSCWLCVGLREKEYCYENEQLSKEKYEEKMGAINLSSAKQYGNFRKRLEELAVSHPFKEFHGHNLENCSGDYLQNCKNTLESFDCEDVEDGKFLYQVVTGAKNIYDIYQYGLNLRESYECSIAGNDGYHILFTHNAHISCSDLLYCWFIQSSVSCFGCFNMHHKKYCILNKQYSKEEYEKLVPKILEYMKTTGEWGELFPITFSPFGYNRTTAQMYYPLTESQAKKNGYTWDTVDPEPPKVTKTIPAAKLPDDLKDIPDDVLNWAILCEETGKPFKITPQELTFYREQEIPLPRRSPDQRHLDRFHRRNPRTFWKRTCVKCEKEIETTYAPDRPEIVYCEQCYLKEVY
ncbi:MAG: hypothetical protein Q7R81_05775 [Candidatus Peregrinibacteria bacterium]|nr:hypothetical protein [Candidatus Peregrinibacteria bacterium]